MRLYKDRWIYIFSTLFFMYLLTILLLLVLTLLIYRFHMSEGIAQFGVTIVYVVSGYFGGFLLGKKICHKRFYFGLGIGALYFLTLLLASLVANGGVLKKGWGAILIFILCSVSAICGEMSRK